MYLIGLTGGIGTGKSTVAAMLAELGGAIVDADAAGHRAYAPGTPGFESVVAAFGPGVVAADGTIDRSALGARVFADPAALQRLNAIVHPIIGRLIDADLAALVARGTRVAVLEAALLFEAGWHRRCDTVWVTTAPQEVVIARLAARSGLSAQEVRDRIAAQLPDSVRRARADVVIDTNVDLATLRQAVERLWRALPPNAR